MKNNKEKFTLKELCIMSFLSVTGMYVKPLVSPVFNLLTDFVRIPGGSVTAGFSMLFLVFAAALIRKKGTAFLMGTVQAVIALATGISSAAGIMVFITYTLPCAVPDFILCYGLFSSCSLKKRMMLSGAGGVLVSAVLSNILHFRLPLVPFVLFYSLGLLSGALGGWLAYTIMEKLPRSIKTTI